MHTEELEPLAEDAARGLSITELSLPERCTRHFRSALVCTERQGRLEDSLTGYIADNAFFLLIRVGS